MKTVNLKTCNNEIEAQMLKASLEAEGIKCFLSNVTMSGYPPMSGVNVHVSENDYGRAMEIVKASEKPEETAKTDKEVPMATDLLTHAVYYFVGFPLIMFLINLVTNKSHEMIYYLAQGLFFSLFMTAFRYFDLKRRKRQK